MWSFWARAAQQPPDGHPFERVGLQFRNVAKSSESALPPFSSGARDDLIQRRTLEAYLTHWDGDVVDPDGIFLWCWDARPHPAFPARADVWSDAPAWRLGHWLNGRVGLSELAQIVADICRRAGVNDVDVSGLTGAVGGYIVDAPSSAREALEPLMRAYDFSAIERDGQIVFAHRADEAAFALSPDDLAEENAAAFATRADGFESPIEARVSFLDAAADYRVASVSARRRDAAEGGVATLDAPLVMESAQAAALAKQALAAARAGAETLTLSLAPQMLALEPGDVVSLDGEASPGAFEIQRIEDGATRRLVLQRAVNALARTLAAPEASAPPAPIIGSSPDLLVLDLPPLPGREGDQRPLAALCAQPWSGPHDLFAGGDLSRATRRAQATQPAIVGALLWALWPGPVGRWDEGNRIRVQLTGAVSSVTEDALLNGANVFAIETPAGWEIVQAREAVLISLGEYELSGFLRGLMDTGAMMGAPTPVGARIVKLDTRLVRFAIGAHEFGETLSIFAPPFGALPSDANTSVATAEIGPRAARPFAPVHLKRRILAGGDVRFSWIRSARTGSDGWGAGEPPLGAASELYRVEIGDGAEIVRSAEVSAPTFLYSAAEQIADFGAPPASAHLRIAQIGEDGLPGNWAERELFL